MREAMTMARVLLVEASPLQRWLLCRQLRALGHEPLPCGSTAEALTRLREARAPLAVALVAMGLPQDNGFACGSALREAGMACVLLLADVPRATDAWWARSLGLAEGEAGVLLRPLPLLTLQRALRAALTDAAEVDDAQSA
jgi:CheY-like chemotaxis protein